MTGKELVRIGQKLYGSHGWQTAMGAALKIDTSTIRRWIAADRVPGPAAKALAMMLADKYRTAKNEKTPD